MFSISTILVVLAFLLFSIIKILPEWQRGLVLRFGRFVGIRGPGLIILVPGVERLIRVDTRTITMDIPPQDVITLDNVSLKVNAVLYFRITDPGKSHHQSGGLSFCHGPVGPNHFAFHFGAVSDGRSAFQRDKINHTLQDILDRDTEPWGIKISKVEVKHIDLPKEMQRAMAKQAEAERERRAKVISAEGEFQRAEKLKDASQVISSTPAAIQLAYLQALNEISTEGTKTIVFPIPHEYHGGFSKTKGEFTCIFTKVIGPLKSHVAVHSTVLKDT